MEPRSTEEIYVDANNKLIEIKEEITRYSKYLNLGKKLLEVVPEEWRLELANREPWLGLVEEKWALGWNKEGG